MFYSTQKRDVAKISTTTMSCGGYIASIMKAPRLKGEVTHSLPPGTPIPVFPIDSLPGAPSEWIRQAGTYVCPVDVEWGIWFNWTSNDQTNTAIVPSVKGMNPITGMRIESPTLEHYVNCCPKHNVPFTHNNHCKECGYEWPTHNYVSYPNILWWDGFRQPDGKVRQFFFTDDDRRDVASHVIGKENTMPAFGFAFYKTKVHRHRPNYNHRLNYGSNLWYSPAGSVTYVPYHHTHIYNSTTSYTVNYCSSESGDPSPFTNVMRSANLASANVSVGAGAEIGQSLSDDELSIEDWSDEPISIIRLYFCFKEQFDSIIYKGIDDSHTRNNNGFLEGMTVG